MNDEGALQFTLQGLESADIHACFQGFEMGI
jgi:hypothetical protein